MDFGLENATHPTKISRPALLGAMRGPLGVFVRRTKGLPAMLVHMPESRLLATEGKGERVRAIFEFFLCYNSMRFIKSKTEMLMCS